MVSPQARREQAAFLQERGLSVRRACGLIGLARSGMTYRRVQPAKDAPVTVHIISNGFNTDLAVPIDRVLARG